ncbi:metal-dependent transcriptional regulator [Anaerovorax odorimutans]|uniref:Metal-dependent transcriptional regulator n=1 Tax=Anaerovorax odorimutans TaxID=109327 RepID=A0ABT1RQ92_9FIRM|nr:metal-dependent transcriptional regulator [Anaerovorax odorimutans]MCQ4637345.1 metal-dependent transcriptional regulator [Anaerovorax odorimutans]
MKIQESAENYLEAILMIKKEKGQVRSIDVVNELGFSKPSVSVAMKQLEENGYIERDSAGYISLLPPGKKIADSIYERHNTLIKILTHLGVSESTARTDACKIEHHISDETFDVLKKHCKEIL